MWRSCGTYVFNKLRDCQAFHPYFEPCSEFLVAGRATAIQAAFPERFKKRLRHTGTRQSFEEYPFSDTGVQGFNERFAFDQYYLAADAEHADLERYLLILDAHARRCGKTPVAKCCRFGLRAAWMNRVLRSTTLTLVRDPNAIFESYWSFGGRRSYFVVASLLIVARNRSEMLFAELADELDLPMNCVDWDMERARAMAAELTLNDCRDIVYFLWVATTLHSLSAAHVVIDVDLLMTDASYRSEAEDAVLRATGQQVRFDDVQAKTAPSRTEIATDRGKVLTRNAVACLGSGTLRIPRLSSASIGALAATSR